jgi:hypothetical protein
MLVDEIVKDNGPLSQFLVNGAFHISTAGYRSFTLVSYDVLTG